jgi:hypothetical protein
MLYIFLEIEEWVYRSVSFYREKQATYIMVRRLPGCPGQEWTINRSHESTQTRKGGKKCELYRVDKML